MRRYNEYAVAALCPDVQGQIIDARIDDDPEAVPSGAALMASVSAEFFREITAVTGGFLSETFAE